MKSVVWNVIDVVLYLFVGVGFLWASAARQNGFYAFPGVCFLVLAAWEVWVSVRDGRAGRKKSLRLSGSLAYIVLALCYVCRGIQNPSGTNAAFGFCWAILGVLYARKVVQDLQATDNAEIIKEEES